MKPGFQYLDITGSLEELYSGLVGILPTGRRQAGDIPAGRLDTSAYPEVVLAAVAQQAGSRAKTGRSGRERTAVASGLQRPGRVARRGGALYAKGAEQRGPSENRLPDAIRPCGEVAAEFNRRMRKTARPVVWEGVWAQSHTLDLIIPRKCGNSRVRLVEPVEPQ